MTTNIAKKSVKIRIDDRIILNVGGWKFETRLCTLNRYPYTRLGELAQAQHMDASWDQTRNEYFFDRNGLAFVSILQLYRTGEFHPDLSMCGNLMKAEIDFWGLSEVDIESCCWGNYTRYKDQQEALSQLDDNFTSVDYIDNPFTGSSWKAFKCQMWRFLEDPSSSKAAKIFAATAVFFVLISITTFVLETHELFRVLKPGYTINATQHTSVQDNGEGGECCCISSYDPNTASKTDPHPALSYIDLVCTAYFTLEFIVRVVFCPNKLEFVKDALNVIDFVCLIPYYINFIMLVTQGGSQASRVVHIVSSIRTIRVLRIFKIMKHYTAFKILLYTIKISAKELLLIVVFLFTGMLIFASVIYYVENPPFTSIPVGFWWALVTMTTVGYGDRVPKSEGGYVVGSICVLCGVLTIAFTVPIVVNNFTLYYSHAQSRVRLPADKKHEIKKRIMRKSERNKYNRQNIRRLQRKKIQPKSLDIPLEDFPDEQCAAEKNGVKVNSETVTFSEQKSHVVQTLWTRHTQTMSDNKNNNTTTSPGKSPKF